MESIIFIARYNDTGDNLTPILLTSVNSLSPTTPPINTKLWVSPWIFAQNQNGSNWILRGPGEIDLWKKREVKSHVRLPLMVLHISSGHQMISNCSPLIRHFKVFTICVFESQQGHFYNMENLDQSSLPPLIKNPETEMSQQGIEPRPPAYWVGTLPKSYLLCRWFRFAQLAKGKKSRP